MEMYNVKMIYLKRKNSKTIDFSVDINQKEKLFVIIACKVRKII